MDTFGKFSGQVIRYDVNICEPGNFMNVHVFS